MGSVTYLFPKTAFWVHSSNSTCVCELPGSMASLPRGRHGFEGESVGFSSAMGKLPMEARDALVRAGIADCRFWAHLAEGEDDPGEVVLDTVLGLCGPLGLEFAEGDVLLWDTLLPELLGLTTAAKAPASRCEARMVRVSDVQITLDHALREREHTDEREARDQVRLAVYEKPGEGREWRPTKYRRRSAEDPTAEREEAEAKERKRWAKQVLLLLVEAQLPFVQTTGASAGTAVESRCCLGLRARTLAKRVRDWRPFRRFLMAHDMAPFPTEIGQILKYLAVREQEGVSASFFDDFRAALKFFETAGERETSDLLHSHPAIANAAKEGKVQQDSGTSSSNRRGRQPPHCWWPSLLDWKSCYW